MSLYRDHILDHYHHPRNQGSLQGTPHRGTAKNETCGDILSFELQIKDGIIEKVAWNGSGCAISQASASLLSEKVLKKDETTALAIMPRDMLDVLGIPLSPARIKCGILSLEALHKALM